MKAAIASDCTVKYDRTYDKIRTAFLASIQDENIRERVGRILPPKVKFIIYIITVVPSQG